MDKTGPALPSWSLTFKIRAKLPSLTPKDFSGGCFLRLTNKNSQQHGPPPTQTHDHISLSSSPPLPTCCFSTNPMAPQGSRHQPEDKSAPRLRGGLRAGPRRKRRMTSGITELSVSRGAGNIFRNQYSGVPECQQITGGWDRGFRPFSSLSLILI